MKTKALLKVALFIFTLQFTIAQTVHTVDNRLESGAEHQTLSSAITAASPGDIIYIHPSPNDYGSITINKTITLVGPGHNPLNSSGLRATLSTITFTTDSADSVIKGLNVNRITVLGTYGLTNIGNIHIINNRITNTVSGWFNGGAVSGDWIIEGNYFDTYESSVDIDINGSDNWIISNNILEGTINDPNRTTLISNNLFINADASGGAEILRNSNDPSSPPLVTNNMFIFTDADVTNISSSGTQPILYTDCLIWNSAEGAASDMDPLPGNNNLNNVDPVFSNTPTSLYDIYNNDYTLGAGSPAIGATNDGGDIGIFGRNFPFDTNGRPHSMPYPTLMNILNSVVQPGQNLSVEFKASQKN